MSIQEWHHPIMIGYCCSLIHQVFFDDQSEVRKNMRSLIEERDCWIEEMA